MKSIPQPGGHDVLTPVLFRRDERMRDHNDAAPVRQHVGD